MEAVTRRAVARPWVFAGAAAALLAAGLALASSLTIRSSLQELLPADMPSVALIDELRRRVGGDGNVLVNVESLDGRAGLPRAQALARVLAGEFLAMGPAEIRSVTWEMASAREWYAAHWPLFASVEELRRARDDVRAEVRRRALEANPLALSLDDEEEETALPEVVDPARPSPRQRVEEGFDAYLDGFITHPDRSSVTLFLRPAATALGVDEARDLLARIRQVADRHSPELREGRLRIGVGGTLPFFIAEYESIVADVGLTGLITGVIVLVSMLLFFRDLRSTLTLGLCVGVAVGVNFGLTRLTIGYLTSQTAFLGSIVAGDGLNYGLVYLARVRQLRRAGTPLADACAQAARTTVVATFLASTATSVSFATLVFAANRGFRHFGIIGGVGMLLCWIATFTLAPAFLSLFERLRPVAPGPERPSVARGRALAERVFARPALVLAAFSAAVLAAAAIFVARLPTAMEHNLENLSNELRGVEDLRRDHARAQAALGESTAGAVALLGSREEAEEFCARIEERMRTPPGRGLIQRCDTISRVVPARQEEKLALIAEIRAEITDARLARASPALRARLAGIRADLAAQRPLSDADAPPALLDGFRERDGSLGRIAAITARPDAKLELAPNLEAFAAGVRGVPVAGRKVDATGENVVFADLLHDIEQEGPRTTVISFAGICAVILLFLREGGLSLRVIVTLVAGVLLMAGITAAGELKINFFNFIAYPITFGISSDYGANIATRVRERGGRVLASLVEVGPAVAMCSWSTIVGYGALLFSLNRALQSFGWYAILGEITTLASALIMLPALILLEQRRAARAAAPA